MQWTAWNNGDWRASGAGYGLKIAPAERDAHFCQSMPTVALELQCGSSFDQVAVNVNNASFWRGCSELRSKEIGVWLMQQGLAPWPKGHPPKFDVQQRAQPPSATCPAQHRPIETLGLNAAERSIVSNPFLCGGSVSSIIELLVGT